MSIPNTLTIYINTNIPGYQFLKYSPSMTIPKTNSKIVCFDPLVKLNQSIVDKTPEQDKIIQFFEKNLFKTLIHRSESFQKYRNIQQATDEGIIDDNIQLTLNNLFKSNQIFYINKKPYSVFSCDWERGNWKIDTKITEIPTNYKGQYGVSSVNYRNIIQEQLLSAKSELKALPPDVIEGPSFEPETIDPLIINQLQGTGTGTDMAIVPYIKPNNNNKQNNNKQIDNKQIDNGPNNNGTNNNGPNNNGTNNNGTNNNGPNNNGTNNNKQIDNGPNNNGTNNNKQIDNGTNDNGTSNNGTNDNGTNDNGTNNNKQIENGPPIKPVKPLLPVPDEIEDSSDMEDKPLTNHTRILRQYFNQSNYFSMLKIIYSNMTPLEQSATTDILKNYSNSAAKTFSKNNYEETVKGLHIVPNNGKGNCFFIAVADAINKYNSLSTNINKITYLNFGKAEPFSQIVVRTIVANAILNNNEIKNDMLNTAEFNKDQMNNEFDETYEENKSEMDENKYMDIIDDIYQKHDNFFIKKPTNMNNDTLLNPFQIMTNKDEKLEYLLSNSWADERTIFVIQKTLGLSIIPIEKNGNKFRIPFAEIYKNVENPSLNKWNKYLFLYLEDNHYEEIYFDIFYNKIKTPVAIFNNNDAIFPPFYILFLIYGTNYFTRSKSEQNEIMILKPYLNSINNSLNHIFLNIDNKNQIFFKNFVYYFPSQKSNILLNKANEQLKNKKILKGGSLSLEGRSLEGGSLEGGLNNKNYKHFTYNLESKSNISYYIIITLDLYPGKNIPITEKPKIACKQCLSKLKKAWADILGYRYSLQPNYYHVNSQQYRIQNTNKNTNKNTNTNKNNRKKYNNNTRKYKY